MSEGLENRSRKVCTAARGTGERRFSRTPPGWWRASESSVPRAVGAGRGAGPRGSGPAGSPDAARSRTSAWNTGSLVYCAIPWPRANGSEPRSRSQGRHPSVWVSSVTTIAEAPIPSARRTKLVDQLLLPRPVQLEPPRRPAQVLRDLLHRPRRLRRDDHRDADGRGRASDRAVGVRVRHAEDADRRQQERRGQALPEELDGEVADGDVAEHPWHEPVALERGHVGTRRPLLPGRAGDVGPAPPLHPALRGRREPVGRHRHERAAAEGAVPVDPALDEAARAGDGVGGRRGGDGVADVAAVGRVGSVGHAVHDCPRREAAADRG